MTEEGYPERREGCQSEGGWVGRQGARKQAGGEGEAGRRAGHAYEKPHGGLDALEKRRGPCGDPAEGGHRILVGTWDAWPAVLRSQWAFRGQNRGTWLPCGARWVRCDGPNPSKISWLPVQTADRDWGGGAGVRAAWVGAGPVVQLGAILMPHFMEEDAGPPPTPMPHSIRSQGSITQPPILGA